MKSALLCLIVLLLNSPLDAVEKNYLSSLHFQPGTDKTLLSLELGHYALEKQVETSSDDIEDFNFTSQYAQLKMGHGLSERHSVYLGARYHHYGKLVKNYDSQFGLEDSIVRYRGLEQVSFAFKTRFTQLCSRSVDQSLILRIDSGVGGATEKNFGQGSTDFYASYLFSYFSPYRLELFGILETGFKGKKKVKRIDGESEVSDPYAITSLDIGGIFRWKSLFLHLQGGFGLTTNHNIKSPSYNRFTDKGFFISAETKLGVEREGFLVELFFKPRSDVFNKIVDDISTADPSLDYEWELAKYGARFVWKL